MPSGEHEIVGYSTGSAMMHYRVTSAPGKTIYLMCDEGFTSGASLIPIAEDAAKALMARLAYTEIGKKGEKANMDYKAYHENPQK